MVDIETTATGQHPESREEAPPPDTSPLARAFGSFANAFAAIVAGQLCATVDVGKVAVAQSGRLVALDRAAAEGHVTPLELQPGGQTAHLALGRAFAGWAADLLLGAPLAIAGNSREILTELDRRSIDTLLEIAPAELGKALSAVVPGTTSVRPERNPTRTSLPPDDCPTTIVSAELVFGGKTSRLALILPTAVATSSASENDDTVEARTRSRDRLLSALAASTVDLEAVLKGSDMRLGDLVRLRPGMVLALPHQAGAPLDCQVNGVTKFKGEMSRSGTGAALVIQSVASALPWEKRSSK